jgi:putative phosphonate metabolism protein
MRIAVFFTLPVDHPLTVAAARWLGRDAFTGRAFAQEAEGGLDAGAIREVTAAAGRYGFHATLKPPFHPAPGATLAEIESALGAFCRRLTPVRIPSLRIERLGSFFALTPAAPAPGLAALADAAVEHFDVFRAPPTDDEVARRHRHELTPRQRENLQRWGYPYVFEDFRFHMTLTGPVPASRREEVGQILERRFTALAARPLSVDALSLFVEPAPPSEFRVHRTVPLARVRNPVDAG